MFCTPLTDFIRHLQYRRNIRNRVSPDDRL